jgi:hypothetical protein
VNTAKVKAYFGHYIAGVLASGFNGGIVALGAIVGPSAATIVGLQVANFSPHQVAATFIGGFVLKAFTYFQAHPIPIFDPDGAVIPQPPVNPTPAAAIAQAGPTPQ